MTEGSAVLRQPWRDNFLGRRESIFGISILLIILCHYGILAFGFVGVDIFVFLSGYGLTQGYWRGIPHLPTFYKRRLLRIYPAYWAVLLPYLFMYFQEDAGIDLLYVLLNAGGFSNRFFFEKTNLVPGSWFVALIILLYFAFPALLRLIKTSPRRPLLVSALCLGVIGLQYSLLPESLFIMTLRIPVFLLGIYAGLLVAEDGDFLKTLQRRTSVLAAVSLAVLAAFVFSLNLIPDGIRWRTGLHWWPSVILGPISVFPLARLLSMVNERYLTLLNSCGRCSLELYLLHEPVAVLVQKLISMSVPFLPHQWSLTLMVSLPTTIVVAQLLRWILAILLSRIRPAS